MRKSRFLLVLLCFLAGCSSKRSSALPQVTPTTIGASISIAVESPLIYTITPSIQASKTPSPTRISSKTLLYKPTKTIQPTTTKKPSPTITPEKTTTTNILSMDFPTPVSGTNVEQRCYPVQERLPANYSLSGTLILSTNPLDRYGDEGEIYSIDMQSMVEQLLLKTKDQVRLTASIYRISPDRKQYIYFEPTGTGTGSQLHINSIDGHETPIAYWDPAWGDGVEWLDNQRLVIRPPDGLSNGTVIILNPLTGERQKQTADQHVISKLSIFAPVIYYHPTLKQAVYSSGDSSFILWDIGSNQDIWSIRGANLFFKPSWSPDGSQFAYVMTDIKTNRSDIYIVDTNGKETRLTNLAETYPAVSGTYIDQMAWSPDSRYIAFLVSVKVDGANIKIPALMVVDVETQETIDYCFTVSIYSDGYIVWSPNGEQLVVASPMNYEDYIETAPNGVSPQVSVILLDLVKELAVQISEDKAPMGWMVNP